jgi:signal transduction histidine kinase
LFHLVAVAKPAVSLTPEEKEWLRQHPKITLGIEESWAPVIIVNEDGSLTGIDIDTLSHINYVLDSNIKLITGKWSKLNEMLKKGTIDGLASSSINAKRAEYANFTKPYTKVLKSIFVKKGNPLNITSPSDLNGKRLAIQKDNIHDQQIAKSHHGITVINVNSYKELIDKLLSGQADAFVGADMSFYNIIDMGITSIEPAFTLGKTLHLSYAIRKDWPELVSILDKAISTLSEKQRLAIKNKYVKREVRLDYSLIFKISASLAAVLLMLFIWNRLLAKRVNEGVTKYKQQQTLLSQQAKMAAMGEMLAAIAHQWKQPLNSAYMSAQMVQDLADSRELDVEEIKYATDNIISEIDFMAKTIDDFRDFYLPTKEKIAFDASTATKIVTDIFLGQFKNANINLRINPQNQFEVLGYPNEFQQVVLSILSNAKDAIIQNGTKDGVISCGFTKTTSKGIVLIKDNGGGIPAELLPDKLFEAFTTTKTNTGTGIGLYIARMIIENSMDGRLMAQNTDDGAEFIIELPLAN